MHELSIAMSIVESLEQEFKGKGDIDISLVNIEVGELSSVVPEALEFAWSEAIKNTFLSKSILKIKIVPARGKCLTCDADVDVKDFCCVVCGNAVHGLISGDELRIDSVKVEEVE